MYKQIASIDPSRRSARQTRSVRSGPCTRTAPPLVSGTTCPPSTRPVRVILTVIVVGLALSLSLQAAPASATPHLFSFSFGSSGSRAGELSEPKGLAVGEAAGDVYVADANNHRVDMFTTAGKFIEAFGDDVDATTKGDICTAESGDECQAGTASASPGAFIRPRFVAVDNSCTLHGLSGAACESFDPSNGDVYVGDLADDRVSKFTAAGALVSSWGNEKDGQMTDFGSISGIATDGSGDLFVYEPGTKTLRAFNPEGEAEPVGSSGVKLAGEAPYGGGGGLEVNAAGTVVYNTIETEERKIFTDLVEYELPSGAAVGLVTGDELKDLPFESEISGAAVDELSGEVFVDENALVMRQYGAGCEPAVKPCTSSDVFGEGEMSRTEDISGARLAGVAVDDLSDTVFAVDESGERVDVFPPPPPIAPSVGLSSASGVTDRSMSLIAEVNANYYPTTFRGKCVSESEFEEGGFSGLGVVSPQSGEYSLGFSGEPQPARLYVTGLLPGTTYHCRVEARNENGTGVSGREAVVTTLPTPVSTGELASCPNAVLRAEDSSMGLPDCRAYELVSPVEKFGNDAVHELEASGAISGVFRSSVSGNRFLFSTFAGAFAQAHGSEETNFYLAERGSTGWVSTGITPYAETNPGSVLDAYKNDAFGPELTDGVLLGGPRPPLSPSAPAGQLNFYRADLLDPSDISYEALTSAFPHNVPFGKSQEALEYGGASADLQHVVFEVADNLTPEAPEGVTNLYEAVAGGVRLVNLEPEPHGGVGIHAGAQRVIGPGMVSADGSRVFFQGNNGKLYVREDGTMTHQLDASEGAGPGGGGEYLGSSTDGSVVVFGDGAEAGLTDDTVSGSGENLYEYDAEAPEGHRLTDLTSVKTAKVLGLTAISEDGSYVYFVAEGVLAGSAITGRPNLYLAHEGHVTFVATLSSEDKGDWLAPGVDAEGGPYDGTVSVSPEGTSLAFQSVRSVTGYDNTIAEGASCGVEKLFGTPLPANCSEVYLYEVGEEQPVCVSCDPTGARPIGPSMIAQLQAEGNLGGELRSLVDGGKRLFFDSFDTLSSADSNHLENVYEYENGHVYLISDGSGEFGSQLLDVSPDGSDVFIATRDRLLNEDKDELIDVYDAREGGGFPNQTEAGEASCEAFSCREPAGSMLSAGAPLSATFNGAGNMLPAPEVIPAPVAHVETTAQKLAKAIKACKKKPVKRRAACERQARARYVVVRRRSTAEGTRRGGAKG